MLRSISQRLVLALACLMVFPASASDVTVTGNKSSFTFLGFAGSSVSAQSITFTLTGGSGTYYGVVTVDQPDAFSVKFTPTSATTAVVTLTPISPKSGSSAGNVTFKLCYDTLCSSEAWSKTIPYTMSVFTIPAAGIAVTGFEGALAAAKTIAISPPDPQRQLVISTGASIGTPNWLSVAHDSDATFSIAASGVGLKAGTYTRTAIISFAGVNGGPSISVPVSFKVASGIVAPASQTLDLTFNASTSGSAMIGFNGLQSPFWTAVSDQPWLVLNTASGTGAGSLAYSIDTSKLAGIANWSSGVARVKISAAGLSDQSFPVTLNKKLPEVHMVWPNPRAGTAGTIKVSGKGFSQFADVAAFRIDGASGVTGAVLSDTQALLSLPTLGAGRYPVSIPNAAGLAASGSSFSVVTPAALSYATVANTGDKRSMLFDATRSAVYAVNVTQSTLVRYRLAAGQWQVDGLPVSAIGDMAFAPDMQTLFVSSGTSTLLAVNPDTLQVQASFAPPTSSTFASGNHKFGAITNNGRLWYASGSSWSKLAYFDLVLSKFAAYGTSNSNLYSPYVFPSADGSELFVTQNGISPARDPMRYRTSDDSLRVQSSMPSIYGNILVSSDGRRMLLDHRGLYDADSLTLVGNVVVAGSGAGTAAVLSPNGSRIYRLVTVSQAALNVDHIDVFDATRVTPGTSELIRLGQIGVADQALSCGSQPAYGCDVVGKFAISPLGDALFWVGNQRLVAVPIPATLQQSGFAGITTYEFFNASLDHYFRTADPAEAAGIDAGAAGPGWVRTGDNFRAFPADSQTPGVKLVCRFYGSVNPGPNSHFYTANAGECGTLTQQQATTPITQKRWNFEGIAFAIRVPDASGCASGETRVYRLYNNGFAHGKDSNHRFTTLQSEYQRLSAAGWVGEDVVMCAPG